MRFTWHIARYLGIPVAVLAAAVSNRALADYQLTVVASYVNQSDLMNDFDTPTMDAAGDLYGTTLVKGAFETNAIYEVVAGSHVATPIYTFPAGGGPQPYAGVVSDAAGNLYGVTYQGGQYGEGSVFELTAGTHTYKTLVSFNGTNGENPWAGLYMDSSGNLYGTTTSGGDNGTMDGSGFGNIFEYSPGSQQFSVLATFLQRPNASAPYALYGDQPYGSLISDAQGNLYGTTRLGAGGAGDGNVYELSKATGLLSDLGELNSTDGYFPVSNLAFDAKGNLLSTSLYGGKYGFGTVFQVNGDGSAPTDLLDINGVSSSGAGLVADKNGNLFGAADTGTAFGAGSVFEIDGQTHDVSPIFSFGTASGDQINSSLMIDANGNLYGTTNAGGSPNGMIFELSAPEPGLGGSIGAITFLMLRRRRSCSGLAEGDRLNPNRI